MSKSTILATISDRDGDLIQKVSVGDYETMIAGKDRHAIAKMIYHRFYGRYIKPFLFEDKRYKKHYKHGFAMMASSCLIIEALEAFYQGWEETQTRGEQAFESFFYRDSELKKFTGVQFYKHVRCGILHQAETTGGFTIQRTGSLFDRKKKAINAPKLLFALEKALGEYQKLLENSEWDSMIWDNFRRKMRFTIVHCSTSRP